MISFINIFLGILAAYVGCGFLFGIFFLFKGSKIDILLADSQKRVRVLLFCGVIATWPFLIGKAFKEN